MKPVLQNWQGGDIHVTALLTPYRIPLSKELYERLTKSIIQFMASYNTSILCFLFLLIKASGIQNLGGKLLGEPYPRLLQTPWLFITCLYVFGFKIFGIQNPLFFISVACCWSCGSEPKWEHTSGPSDYSYAKQTGSRTHSSHGKCTTKSELYFHIFFFVGKC